MPLLVNLINIYFLCKFILLDNYTVKLIKIFDKITFFYKYYITIKLV